MEEGISFETKLGDGSTPNQGLMNKIFSAGSRILTGESLFMTHFTNQGLSKRKVSFSAPYPGKIIPVDLKSSNGQIIVKKDGFLCGAFGTKVCIHLNRKLGAGLIGGGGSRSRPRWGRHCNH